MRLTRVRAEVRLKPRAPLELNLKGQSPDGALVEANVMLNDLSQHGVGLYSPVPVPNGTLVTLRIFDPKEISVEGKVIWAQSAPDHKIISQRDFSLRLGIHFSFKDEMEERAFAAFLEELKQNHLYPPRK